MNTEKVTDNHYDLNGLSMARVLRLSLRWKLMGLSNISGKSPLKDLLEIWVRQRFGKRISVITVKHEKRWREALTHLRKLRFHIVRFKNRVLRRPPGSTPPPAV